MIFDGLTPADGDDCLQSAVSAVLRQAQKRGLWPPRARWSLAELAPDEADFVWLRAWAWQIKGTTLLPWINSWRQHKDAGLSGAGGVGLLLLLLASEAARREATEGTLWPTIERQYAGGVRRLLFLHGQPAAEHKQALQSAAWELNLRHVFGIDGLHNRVTCVYLQFGFTRRGFEANLPLWLTAPQNRSNAVEGLLDGPLQSASFQEMWNALSGYRRRDVNTARLETVLGHSPWLLPEWHESLTRLSQTKMHLGGGQSGSVPGQTPTSQNFLDVPTLRWDGAGPPKFVCQWQGPSDLDLPDDDYTLVINGCIMAKLRRQSDGGFVAQPDGKLCLLAPLADWTTAISVSVSNRTAGRRWGETVMVTVDHPADVSIHFARCHGQSLTCETADGVTRVGPLTLTPGDRTIAPELTLGIILGDAHACRRLALPFLNLVGALQLMGGERRPLMPQTVLTTLPPLAGFGAPLLLRSRAYNDREEPLIIAQEVVNPGQVSGVMQDLSDEARHVTVHFKQLIEPDKDHTLL